MAKTAKKKESLKTETFFKKKGLVILGIIGQSKRSDKLKVKRLKDKKTLFLKIAKDKTTSLLFRNQSFWTKQVAAKIPPGAGFTIPAIIDDGFLNQGYFWLLTEYVPGQPFAEIKDSLGRIRVKNPENYFEKIIELILFLAKTEARGLKGIDNRLGREPKTTKLAVLEKAIRLGEANIPHYSELLKIINANYQNLKKVTVHGDLTPINLMVDREERVVLVDSDLGNFVFFRYYDVAEFYNRLYSRCCRPDLASRFLSLFVKRLRKDQVQRFLNNFICLIALRAIGNFSEIQSGRGSGWEKRLRFAKRLAQEIASYRILEWEEKKD
jgi:hypothetical protein